MSFPKYPEYKDSGTEWLGKVPAHWKIPKLKNLARIRNGRDYKEVEVELGGYPVIGSGGEFSRANNYLYKGESVLLGRKGTIDKPLYINGPFWTVDTMFYTEISQKVDGRFLFYYATCFRFDQYSTNTALPSMAQEDLANIQLAVPELHEQAVIAAFLDHETGRIDVLVAEQQRLIELLKEKRQSVISHAVTKGLDPDVPMKDSGVEWLGEVPAHWKIGRVKNVASFITSGPRGWSDYLAESGEEIFVQSGDLDDQLSVNFWDAKRIRSPMGAEGYRTRIKYGDVLVCITGANTGRVAVPGPPPSAAFINQHLSLVRLRQGDALPQFVGYVLASEATQSYFRLEQYGLKEGLNLGDIADAPLVIPPKNEQELVVEYLKGHLQRLDRLAKDARHSVELLQERRSALISAAVTGKIDVRGWQPPEGSTASSEATQTEMV